jgi:uncharacterized protein YacL
MRRLIVIIVSIIFISLVTILSSFIGHLESTYEERRKWTIVTGVIGFVSAVIVVGITLVMWKKYSSSSSIQKSRIFEESELQNLLKILPQSFEEKKV